MLSCMILSVFFFGDGRKREFVGCCTRGMDGGLRFFKKREVGGGRSVWSEVEGEREVGLGLKIFAKWLL